MSDSLVIEAVRKTVTVDCAVEDAFRVFTAEIGTWWPTERYSIYESNLQEVVLEAREGGELYEVSTSGETGHWATVLAWEPPKRLVLGWNTGAKDPVATELEIRFVADGDRTRVELEHRGWEALENAAERRGSYHAGWDLVLEAYGKAIR